MNTEIITLDLMVRWLTGQAIIEEFPVAARPFAMKAGEEMSKILEEALRKES